MAAAHGDIDTTPVDLATAAVDRGGRGARVGGPLRGGAGRLGRGRVGRRVARGRRRAVLAGGRAAGGTSAAQSGLECRADDGGVARRARRLARGGIRCSCSSRFPTVGPPVRRVAAGARLEPFDAQDRIVRDGRPRRREARHRQPARCRSSGDATTPRGVVRFLQASTGSTPALGCRG